MFSVYGDACPCKTMIYNWHNFFKQGRHSIEDDPRPGRPVESTTVENVEKLEKNILEDARLKTRQLAEMIGVSATSILNILHDYLGMSKVCARMLTPNQKQRRVECCREFLKTCGENMDEVLGRNMTRDETWVHHYESESKYDSIQWHKKGTPPPRNSMCLRRLETHSHCFLGYRGNPSY